MSLIIRAAARTLPAGICDRYREQWLADARDATEAGLRPASIALAALAFAITLDRPLASRAAPTAEQWARRARLAVGLALSAALFSLSQYPRIGFSGLTSVAIWDFADFFVSMLLVAYAVLAPITALVLVRGARQRWAVVLLALATTAPLAAGLGVGQSFNSYLSGLPPFVAAAVLIAVACALLWRPSGGSLRAPILGTIAVWAVTAAGLIYGAAVAWPARTLPVYALETTEYYAEWLQLKLQFEALVDQTFVVWAIAGAMLGILVFVVGRLMSERRAIALGAVAALISVLGASGVLGLLELGMGGTIAPVLLDPLRLTAQVLLVAVTLVSVGGLRLARVRHRHDVEGAVELL